MISSLRLPARIGSQIALLVVGVIAVLYLALAAILVWNAPRDRPGPPALEIIATTVRLVAQLPAADRLPLVEAANRADDRFRFAIHQVLIANAVSSLPQHDRDGLAMRLGERFHVAPAATHPGDRDAGHVVIALPDGSALDVAFAPTAFGAPPARPISVLLIATIVLVGLNIGALTLWASRGITAPLARFAAAAEEFSIDRDPSPLREEGPAEVRMLARALNRLRDRVHALFGDRTRMLAAVGHDLRTPITRMRLRAEFIEDEALRSQFTRDLHHMDAMVQGALSYLRDIRRTETRLAFDLSSLLQTVAHEFGDMGHEVAYAGPRRVVAVGDAQQIERAVANLVENAVRYGSRVAVMLREEATRLVIEVSDDGPGIPHEDRQRLLEPFMRGDEARGRIDSEGFGLGLSIVHAIVASHGGELTLEDNEPTGLRVRFALPRRALHEPHAG